MNINASKSRAPPELAADWVEYLIRHKGAKHLRSAALDLNFYQYMLLDVILTLLAAVIVLFSILYEQASLEQSKVCISNVDCEAIRTWITLKLGDLLSFMIRNAFL